MLEEPLCHFHPSSTARMCVGGCNWVNPEALKPFSGIILMISKAPETQSKQILGRYGLQLTTTRVLVWTGGLLDLSSAVCMCFRGYNGGQH